MEDIVCSFNLIYFFSQIRSLSLKKKEREDASAPKSEDIAAKKTSPSASTVEDASAPKSEDGSAPKSEDIAAKKTSPSASSVEDASAPKSEDIAAKKTSPSASSASSVGGDDEVPFGKSVGTGNIIYFMANCKLRFTTEDDDDWETDDEEDEKTTEPE